MTPFIAFGLTACLIVASLVLSRVRSQRISGRTWDELIERMQPVASEGIRILALDRAARDGADANRASREMLDLVGGTEGLRQMSNNAAVLIALAAYAESSNEYHRNILTDRMRADGVVVRRAVRSIQVARLLHVGTDRIPDHVRDAAASYHSMRQRLPALFALNQAGMLAI